MQKPTYLHKISLIIFKNLKFNYLKKMMGLGGLPPHLESKYGFEPPTSQSEAGHPIQTRLQAQYISLKLV